MIDRAELSPQSASDDETTGIRPFLVGAALTVVVLCCIDLELAERRARAEAASACQAFGLPESTCAARIEARHERCFVEAREVARGVWKVDVDAYVACVAGM